MKKYIFIMMFIFLAVGMQNATYAWDAIDKTIDTLDRELEEGSLIGMGVMVSQSPYEGVEDAVYAAPIVLIEYKNLFVGPRSFGYYLNTKEDPLRVGVIGSPRLQGYKDGEGESAILNGMEDRDWAFDGGLRLNWNNDILDMNLEGVMDLSGTHDGQEVSLTLSKKLFDGFLTPRAQITWQSEDLLGYYYGVRASEATASRNEYEPDSGLEYALGLTTGIPFGEKWAIIGDVQCRFLGDEVKDSPIVNEDVVMFYVAGIAYRF